MRHVPFLFSAMLVACGGTVSTPVETDSGVPDAGPPDSGMIDSGAIDSGAPDAGSSACGDMTCTVNEFCVERVHAQDAGPKPPTWMCQTYWNCSEPTCACALASFMSASCIAPTCVSAMPVVIRCDDLN